MGHKKEDSLLQRFDQLEQDAQMFAFGQGQRFQQLVEVGNEFATKNGLKNLNGIAAVQYHLMQQYHWLPSQVRSLTVDDMWFALGKGPHRLE